jgi:hypothetical protein
MLRKYTVGKTLVGVADASERLIEAGPEAKGRDPIGLPMGVKVKPNSCRVPPAAA